MRKIGKIDVEDWEEYDRWIKGKAKSTKYRYKSTLKDFCEYHGMTPREVIEEAREGANEESETPWLEENPADKRLTDFFTYLITSDEKEGKGISRNSARTYWRIIKSFYGRFIHPNPINADTPRASTENEAPHISRMDVRKMVYSAPTLRDRAIIITSFQSGMNTKEIIHLDYEDYQKGRKLRKKINEDHQEDFRCVPIKKVRKKTQIRHTTFLGKDSVEAIETYFEERRKREGRIDPESPLFVKYRKGEPKRLNPRTVQDAMRKTADTGGFERNGHRNPVQLKNLRDSFSSILKGEMADRDNLKGDNVVVEYWMGHSRPYNGAYEHLRLEKMMKVYEEYERYISISHPSEEAERERKRTEQRLGRRISIEADKREKLRERIEELEEELIETKNIAWNQYMRAATLSDNQVALRAPATEEMIEKNPNLEGKTIEIVFPKGKGSEVLKVIREILKDAELEPVH